MTAESELRPTPSPWGEIELTPEIDTPEKRLSAVLNILQNGAQTLTVLTMPADTRRWQSYYRIWQNLNETAGLEVLKQKTSTKNHLVFCIEPVGAAARSTLDDRDWALTGFGIKIKAPLIFAWQQLLHLRLDAMQVLANNSLGRKDLEDNIISTPALVRYQILTALAAASRLRTIDLAQITNVGRSNVVHHLNGLKTANLIDSESADPESGNPVTVYQITPEGLATNPWPSYRTSPTRSAQIEQTARRLTAEDRPITLRSVIEKPVQDLPGISGTLAFFASRGFLTQSKFHCRELSEVRITDPGIQVVERVLKPLSAWTQDNKSVAQINEIDRRLKINPDAYISLYPPIAESYMQHSPIKNKDPEAKSRQITALIKSRPGQLTRSDLARLLNVSGPTIARHLKPLLETCQVVQQKAAKGSRFFLAPGPNMADFDKEYEEELKRGST